MLIVLDAQLNNLWIARITIIKGLSHRPRRVFLDWKLTLDLQWANKSALHCNYAFYNKYLYVTLSVCLLPDDSLFL